MIAQFDYMQWNGVVYLHKISTCDKGMFQRTHPLGIQFLYLTAIQNPVKTGPYFSTFVKQTKFLPDLESRERQNNENLAPKLSK